MYINTSALSRRQRSDLIVCAALVLASDAQLASDCDATIALRSGRRRCARATRRTNEPGRPLWPMAPTCGLHCLPIGARLYLLFARAATPDALARTAQRQFKISPLRRWPLRYNLLHARSSVSSSGRTIAAAGAAASRRCARFPLCHRRSDAVTRRTSRLAHLLRPPTARPPTSPTRNGREPSEPRSAQKRITK